MYSSHLQRSTAAAYRREQKKTSGIEAKVGSKARIRGVRALLTFQQSETFVRSRLQPSVSVIGKARTLTEVS